MVRLRREIEGVRRNHAAPKPAFAQEPALSAQILPDLDRWLLALPPGRVALAGSVRRDLAEALARAGHWVTVADLGDDELRQWHAELGADVAGHLTLLARPYGDVSFGPASFDAVALFDALAGYREPAWILHKAGRELKPDGLLAVREPVSGALPPDWAGLGRGYDAARLKLIQHGLALAPRVLTGPVGPWLLQPLAIDAVERRAHLRGWDTALAAAELQAALAQVLQIEQAWIGHSARLAAATLPWGARPLLRRVALAALARTPALADAQDAGLAVPRVVGVVARRALRPVGAAYPS